MEEEEGRERKEQGLLVCKDLLRVHIRRIDILLRKDKLGEEEDISIWERYGLL